MNHAQLGGGEERQSESERVRLRGALRDDRDGEEWGGEQSRIMHCDAMGRHLRHGSTGAVLSATATRPRSCTARTYIL